MQDTLFGTFILAAGTKPPTDRARVRLVNSAIVAFISLFSVLATTGFPPSGEAAYAAFMSFGLTFFSQWAYERGIQRKGKK